MPPEELAALFETMEFSVSISSEDAARRARRGLFSGAVGVSSSSAVKLKDPGRGGHAPDGSRVKISLPGLIAPESRVD
jgi:hypothetical protein